MALQQALANAIIHGNLEVTGEQMQDTREAMVTGRGRGVFEQRQHQAPYRDRRVFVDLQINRDQARFVIRDEGPGFDSKQYTAAGANDAELKRGRGIRLMRMFMSEVTFNDRGNEVTMVKHREKH
jgi:anti-sigma regulatory factor (Ser/Thr protein kinase)